MAADNTKKETDTKTETETRAELIDWLASLEDVVGQVEAGACGAASRLMSFDVADGRRASVYLLVTTDLIDDTEVMV